MQLTQLLIDAGLVVAVALTAVMMVSAVAGLMIPFLPPHDRPRTSLARSRHPSAPSNLPSRTPASTIRPSTSTVPPSNVTPLFPEPRNPGAFAGDTPRPKRVA